MARKFKKPDYNEVLKQAISLEEALPANHLGAVQKLVGTLTAENHPEKQRGLSI